MVSEVSEKKNWERVCRKLKKRKESPVVIRIYGCVSICMYCTDITAYLPELPELA